MPSSQRDKLSQTNLNKIEQHVSSFYTSPQCNPCCNCHICKEQYEILEKGKQFMRQTSSMIRIQTGRIKQFFRLLSGNNNKSGFHLQIPTMCFFQKGECKLMFKSRNECIILQQNQHIVSKKNIANCFIQATRKKSQSKPSHNEVNHIRHFGTVIPSYIHSSDPKLLYNNQTSSLSQQPKKSITTIQTFYFHKDNQLELSQENNNHSHGYQRSANEQVAIVKYLQNRSLELVNEKQLRLLLKSHVHTQNIQFIQSYIKPNERSQEFLFCQYKRFDMQRNGLMWGRAEVQVKLSLNIINSYAKDYIPMQTLQSYQQLLKQIPHEYLLYQTYKIVHYLSLSKHLQVNILTTLWIRDQFREICFFSLLNFEYEDKIEQVMDFSDSYKIRGIMQKPFNELEQQLWSMWGTIKEQKLLQLNRNDIDANGSSIIDKANSKLGL